MNRPLPKQATYTGPSGALKKASPWLASEDIGTGREVKVIVEAVELYEGVEFDKGRKEEVIGALKFRGKEKRMVLNAVNRKAMVRQYGMLTGDWVGKEVILYVDPNVRFGREKVAGLRIKFGSPTPPTDAFEGDAQTAADLAASREVQS